MMSVMRSIVLAAPLAALLAACGNGPVVLSEEEKAARVTVNPFQENLTPDPALAASTITLPAAQPMIMKDPTSSEEQNRVFSYLLKLAASAPVKALRFPKRTRTGPT